MPVRYEKCLGAKSVSNMSKVEIRKFAEDAGGKPIQFYRIFGRVIGHEVVKGKEDFKDSTRLKGEFQANFKDEIVKGTSCFLPCGFENGIVSQLMSNDDESSKFVDFGIDIKVQYDTDSATEYVYKIVSIMEPEKNDTLSLLENKFSGNAISENSESDPKEKKGSIDKDKKGKDKKAS